MKKYILIFIVISSLISFFACEKTEKIEDFPLYPPKLVLNSYLNADSNIKINISKSLSVLDNALLKNVDDAKIKIYEENTLLASIDNSNGNGYYTLNYKPKIGLKYNVEGQHSSLENISSQTTIPNLISLKKFQRKEIQYNEYSSDFQFIFDFDDNPSEKNYYMIKINQIVIDTIIHQNDTILVENDIYKIFLEKSNNPAVDLITYGEVFFTDEFFNGKSYSIEIETSYLNTYGYKIKYIGYLYSLSEENYKYRKSLAVYKNSRDNPFAEPVQVFNNIEGGFGIFAGESVKTDTIIMDGKYWGY